MAFSFNKRGGVNINKHDEKLLLVVKVAYKRNSGLSWRGRGKKCVLPAGKKFW